MLSSALLLPVHLLLLPWAPLRPGLHDGFVSALRAYSPSAFKALGRVADPGMRVEVLAPPTRLGPPSVTVCSRPGAAEHV
ncbi:hypothetical protein H7H78_04615 [Mycobacterium shinjukuense]|uniref:Uncharacterized protein n=1 Tax=Mycobacterium shinjukuense TaxID=398694 RepID=A0A7I7MM90_9MYCO|nr:hypothetical protein [Mycobacterium shinjukuense]ORB67461.1 hypothetical protein BST45_12480 [Mycobacterium shinjukuense]BBX73358.1 hypothetical protein MSHI_12640 [Mycobacterium shinjukuense]